MKPLEPLLPGEMRSEYLRRVDSPMGRARALVEAHIADYGMVPHPDRIKEAIAAELQLGQTPVGIEQAAKIVAEFEGIFGKLTATERRWLTRRIAGQEGF
jgi:hypothetical protein